MPHSATLSEWILGFILILSSIGVISAKKPIYSSLSFLLTLLTLSMLYLNLSAEFIAMIQVLVYAGAILVIFMFMIVLFQDAHQDIERYPSKSLPLLLFTGGALLTLSLLFLASRLIGFVPAKNELPSDFGTVQSIGNALYLDFFFPFEAITLLFLVAAISALYIARKRT